MESSRAILSYGHSTASAGAPVAARDETRAKVWPLTPPRASLAAMVSMRHECLVDLFRNRPSLAAEILVEALGVELPRYDEARVASIDLTETQPAEYRADIVILLL